MNTIPLCRPVIEQEDLQAVEEVLKSGWLTHGPKTTEFEQMFAEYIGVKHAVAMNSCTSALFLSILANNITGDLLVPSFTFVASANAVKTAGATPVFVEINYHDCNVNPDLLEHYVTPQTQAIMVVHYAGQCCDMEKIVSFANKYNLLVIEDSAETIGGTYNGQRSGSWGIGCFSFFPTKNITTGEGGMLTTNNDTLATNVRAFIGHGIDKTTFQREKGAKPWFRAAVMAGYNFRLSNILAAIGVEQMKKIERMNQARREHSFYLLDKLKEVEEIDLPLENSHCKHVYQMFTIKLKKGNRDNMVFHLRKQGISASVHFDPPVHKHPAYAAYNTIPLPVTEKVAETIVTLPMFPQLTQYQLDTIITSVKDYFVYG
ncbi:MAG: DegT/DnrJ/EryC1/StrS aminotransferase family protein [Deltaproteobacteria bacterium]|nr:DegT/DnrJ/EryC1/StrS aminotransferase family protein [Deltaproteobacteria bacterium]